MAAHAIPDGLRLLLAHKQSTSARVRFLRFEHGVLAATPLPAFARVRDDPSPAPVLLHPAQYLLAAETQLDLREGSLKLEPEFRASVETPDCDIEVRLAYFTAIDPPFAIAEAHGARFIAITEARGCTPVELALLRRAYETVLG